VIDTSIAGLVGMTPLIHFQLFMIGSDMGIQFPFIFEYTST